jgi:uncharacterized membrane protein YphA (DoxX/SURF4 family)
MTSDSKRAWWQDPSLGLDVVRVYLGVGLMVRGALFVGRPEVLLDFLKRTDSWFVPLAISQYVVAAHLCGGVLLALGLGTRVAAALQIPPLIGAVLLVHLGEGLLSAGQSLEFAALVLAMLTAFTAFGSGRLSLDHWLARRNAETQGDAEGVPERERRSAEHAPVHP